MRATVTELAAGLRELSVGGVDLVETYPEDQTAPMGAGLVFAPWPNRVRDATWPLHGIRQLLDVTEPNLHNALHGLLCNTGYRAARTRDDEVTLAAEVFPQHGYPFHLSTSVRYTLSDDGITVTHVLQNRSADAAPVAVGAHPYLTLGAVPASELSLQVAGDRYFAVDEQLIPVAEYDVEGTTFDLRRGQPIAGLDLNVGYADLHRENGDSRHRLSAADGRFVELWADANFDFLQVYTPRRFPRAGGTGLAVAVEPMSAAADAFNSGRGIRWLEPDESWSLSWGIRLGGEG
ncbi:MAG: aldose 1-epimerase family protein [Microbacteriaceae bacterium]